MDPTEVALVIGGWIVAGFVTLAGVVIAHKLDAENRQREQDQLVIFEPLRKEMMNIAYGECNLDLGNFLWFPSESFQDIMKRGALHYKRLDGLLADVEGLMDLYQKHSSTRTAFYDAISEALKTTLGSAEVKVASAGSRGFLEATGIDSQDGQLRNAVASSNKELWLRYMGQLRKVTEPRGVLWDTVTPSIENLFTQADSQVSKAREVYTNAAHSLLSQAERIRTNLDTAIQKSKRYSSR